MILVEQILDHDALVHRPNLRIVKTKINKRTNVRFNSFHKPLNIHLHFCSTPFLVNLSRYNSFSEIEIKFSTPRRSTFSEDVPSVNGGEYHQGGNLCCASSQYFFFFLTDVFLSSFIVVLYCSCSK